MAEYLVVYNSRAGFLRSLRLLKDLFAIRGLDAEFVKCRKGISAQIKSKISAGTKVVVAAGGDGTVNTVVGCLVNTNVAMGIIPIGTFNHFAKDIGLPLEVDKAISVIAKANTMMIDTVKVNSRYFVNLSSLGLYPRLIHTRDNHSLYLGRWLSGAIGTIRAASWPLQYQLDFTLDGRRFKRKSSLIVISNNSYEITKRGFSNRRYIDRGNMSLYIIKAAKPWTLAKLTLKAYLGNTDNERNFEEYTAKKITIKPGGRRRKIQLALDGELVKIAPPLSYSVKPKSLKVIANKR